MVIAAFALGLSACTNPYDPVQRGLGGGIWGAASGAAIGAAVGGGPRAALGAAIGGATGIFGGVATTPPPPPGTYFGYPLTDTPATDIRVIDRRAMDTQAFRDIPLTPVLPGMDILATWDTRLTPDPRRLDTSKASHTLLIRAPVTEIRCMAIPAITFRRTGLLGDRLRDQAFRLRFAIKFTLNPQQR